MFPGASFGEEPHNAGRTNNKNTRSAQLLAVEAAMATATRTAPIYNERKYILAMKTKRTWAHMSAYMCIAGPIGSTGHSSSRSQVL